MISTLRGFRKWNLIIGLWVVYLINMAFPMYGGSVANAYMGEALNMSRGTLGAGFATFSLFQGLSGILVLLSIKKSGVRRTLLAGALIIATGAVWMTTGVHNSLQYLLVYGVIMGMGVGFGTVVPITTGITLWFDRRRAMAMSLVLTAGGVGGFLVAPLIDRVILSGSAGWRGAWQLSAAAAILSAGITFLFIREPERPSPLRSDYTVKPIPDAGGVYRTTRDWDVAMALKSPVLWLFAAASLGFVAPYMLVVAHSVVHLRDLGVSSSAASLSVGLMTVSSIIGRLIAGYFGDRIEPRVIWSAALAAMAAGCLVLIRADTPSSIVVYAVLVGVGFGAAYVCRALALGNYFGSNIFASLSGMLSSVLTIFSSAVPFLGGLVRDSTKTYSPAFVGVSVLALAGTVCLLLVRTVE